MKNILLLTTVSLIFCSCSIFKKDKYGCPTNGRNVGAEKILAGDKKAIKAERKAKFLGSKSY
ncbi:hypothetical protein BH09BAC2_BH09BAC2_07550 [soil metagenome]